MSQINCRLQSGTELEICCTDVYVLKQMGASMISAVKFSKLLKLKVHLFNHLLEDI